MHITESPLNNPQHPCGFCSKPVPICASYCDNACRTGDELLKALEDGKHLTPEEAEKAYQEWLAINLNLVS